MFKNKYFSKNIFQKDQQYNTTVIENVKNKTLLKKTSEFIVKSQENQPKVVYPSLMKAQESQKKINIEFMLCRSVSFMPSPASIYNLLFFMKLTQN